MFQFWVQSPAAIFCLLGRHQDLLTVTTTTFDPSCSHRWHAYYKKYHYYIMFSEYFGRMIEEKV